MLPRLARHLAFVLLSLTTGLFFSACESPSSQKGVIEYSINRADELGENNDDDDGIGGTGIIADNGLGGTGRKGPDEDGLGGTGKTGNTRELVDNGLGGTGRKEDEDGIGGTGIVGTITKFGSIWVNNAHVIYDENTRVTANQKPADLTDFKLGQLVSILSHEEGKQYQASQIDIVFEVVGPVSGINLKRKSLSVLKQTVKLDKETRIFNRLKNKAVKFDALMQDMWVKVSGLRDNKGHIFASRIDIIQPQGQVQIIGKLIHQEQNNYSIQNQSIFIDSLLAPQKTEQRMLVSGKIKNGVLVAESVGEDSTQMILDLAEEVLLEGFIYPSDLDDIINIGGIELELPDDFNSDIFDQIIIDDMPIQIFGTMEDGDYFEIDDVIYLEDYPRDYIDDIENWDDLDWHRE